MATINDWLEGARVRTLPASLAPVIIGAGVAVDEGGFSLPRTLLAAVVALAFQIGVNFSNDYSDGVRGTDDFRTGPPRLTGGGKASPKLVLKLALAFFALGALAGFVLVALSGKWWILAVGAASILAAWFYTGGKNPYGYMGLGEVFVMVFFGWVATVGTVYLQTGTAPATAWISGTGVGFIACALLMVNNIRDIPTDKLTGKRTLAVRMGDRAARYSFVVLLVLPLVLLFALVVLGRPWTLLPLVLALLVGPISRSVLGGAKGRELIPALKYTGLYELSYGVLLCAGFVIGTL
ncbi:MAG: 1,4-dihydroxy-2-naphthoate polyprenyltransferase [Actinomycetaceae bacterium]|nr:1,4-dihydroxy-2-naphthoate polyprenyltransferase [Actinomycetaceae bacterium]